MKRNHSLIEKLAIMIEGRKTIYQPVEVFIHGDGPIQINDRLGNVVASGEFLVEVIEEAWKVHEWE